MDKFLSSDEFNKLREEFDHKISSSYTEKSFNETTQLSNSLIDTEIFDNSVKTINFLWLFHQYRLNQDKFTLPFQALLDMISRYCQLPDGLIDEKRQALSALLDISILHFQKYVKASPSIEGCFSTTEKQSIDLQITKYEQQNYLNEKALEIEEAKQLSILNRFKRLPDFKKTIYQIEFLRDLAFSNDEQSTIAEAPINYLLDENDIIPDNLGIFGLIDDIFVIERAFHKVQKNKEFHRLVAYHNEVFPTFSLPSLDTPSGNLSLINIENLIKASYSVLDDKPLKRALIVQDIGPLGVLCSLGKSLTDRISVSEPLDETNILPDIGKKLYFGDLKNKKIIGEYIGRLKHEEHSDLHWIGFEGGRLTFNSNQVKDAKIVNDDEKVSREKVASKFKNTAKESMSWTEVNFSRSIQNVPSKGKILLIAEKGRSFNYLEEEFYGKTISSWLGVRYVNSKYKFEDFHAENCLFPEPQIYLVSDSSIAVELLSDYWHEDLKEIKSEFSLIVVTKQDFLKDEYFLNTLNQNNSDKLIILEYFSQFISQVKKYEFEEMPALPDKIYQQELNEGKTELQRFFNRSSPFDIKFEVVDDTPWIADLIEFKKLFVEEDTYILKFQFLQFIYEIRKRIIPFVHDGNLAIKIKNRCKDLINELKYHGRFQPDLLKVADCIEKNEENILHFSKTKFIQNILEESDKNYTILCDGSQINGLEKFIKQKGLKAKISKFSDLDQIENFDCLLVPSFFKKKIAQQLRNNRYADEHLFIVTETEKLIHDFMQKREESIFNNLYQNNSINIENTLDVKIEKELDLYDPFQEIFQDTFKELGDRLVAEPEQTIEVSLFGLNNFKLLGLPPRSEVICLSHSDAAKIDLKTAAEISEGDILLWPETQSGNDLLEHMLKNNEDDFERYLQVLEKAKAWQIKLKNYKEEKGFSLEQLREKLEEVNIKRQLPTIKSWLNDPETIGPKRTQLTIESIYKLISVDPSEADICVSSVKKIYQLRAKAKEELIKKLYEERVPENSDYFHIDLNGKNIKYELIEIKTSTSTSMDRKYLYKFINLTELQSNI